MHPEPSSPVCQHIQSELSFWVNGRLAPERRAAWTEHLRACSDCAAALQMEEQMAHAIQQPSVVDFAPQMSWQKLQRRLETRTLPEPAARRQTLWPALAASLVLLLSLGWLGRTPLTSAPLYSTLTQPEAMTTPILQVVFQEELSAAAVTRTFADVGAEVVSGPSPAGVWRARLNPGVQAAEAAAELARHPQILWVDIAEPRP